MSDQNNEKNTILDDEKDLVLDHDYDGIQELDHPLPSWWLFTFWGGIIFAVGYVIYYWFLGGAGISETYYQRMSVIEEKRAITAKDVAHFDITAYRSFLGSEGLSKGNQAYQMYCASCHMPDGTGDIGSNLTDDYWSHATGDAQTIYEVIVNGRLDVGMPGWEGILSKDEIYAVTAFVRSLRGSAPESANTGGEFFDPPAADE